MFESRIMAAWMMIGSLPFAAAFAADGKPTEEIGLSVGQKMPFHVVDFVNEMKKSHGGCPSVMISNSGRRGIIVWSRGTDDAAFKLAEAIDKSISEDSKMQHYLVVFDRDREALKEKAKDVGRVVVGKARGSADKVFDQFKVDPKTLTLVFLLDQKDIKQTWEFEANKLSDDKIKEVVAATKKFAADEAATAELKKLDGMWQLVSAVKDGQETPEETIKKIRVEIKDGKHTVHFGDETVVKEIPFTVDPTKEPKQSVDTLPDGTQIKAIYKLDGETLTSCSAEVGNDHPTEFASKPGSGNTLRVFKRLKG